MKRKILPDSCNRCGRVNYPLFWLLAGNSVKAAYLCRCGHFQTCWWDESCLYPPD